ncbi:hypothetical protein [Sorangium sp. So ce388]|uniref:hypothetical protein n=1 Tax=Sorangium sp. So ce388 TaxID=3133309 RepID=UPI003F5AFAD1
MGEGLFPKAGAARYGERAGGELQEDVVEAIRAESLEPFGQHGALRLVEGPAELLLELSRQRSELPLLEPFPQRLLARLVA